MNGCCAMPQTTAIELLSFILRLMQKIDSVSTTAVSKLRLQKNSSGEGLTWTCDLLGLSFAPLPLSFGSRLAAKMRHALLPDTVFRCRESRFPGVIAVVYNDGQVYGYAKPKIII